MSNEQLAILLDKYQRMLEFAIEEIEKELPEDMKIHSKNFFGFEVISCPILDKLDALDTVLQSDISLLKDE